MLAYGQLFTALSRVRAMGDKRLVATGALVKNKPHAACMHTARQTVHTVDRHSWLQALQASRIQQVASRHCKVQTDTAGFQRMHQWA